MSEMSNKLIKSQLFHLWKKARVMYEMINDETKLEDWVKKDIYEAYESLDKALQYTEYEKIFPEKKDEEDEGNKNNYLSNEDKRYPTPTSQESGDQFMTRCILDANMKKRYPVQGDRFAACMSIFNDNKNKETKHTNPGEKFEDPMQVKDPELPNPTKPLLP